MTCPKCGESPAGFTHSKEIPLDCALAHCMNGHQYVIFPAMLLEDYLAENGWLGNKQIDPFDNGLEDIAHD